MTLKEWCVKAAKEVFTMKLLPAPPVDDAILLEGQLLGHPKNKKKFITVMKKEDLESQLKLE